MNILLLLSFTAISLAKIVVEISPIEVVDTGQNDEEILITEVTVQNAPEIFRDGTKFYNLLFASRNDTGFDQLIEEFHSAAVDFQNEQVRFCYINTDLEANNLLLNLFELKKEDLPAIRLFEIEENKELFKNAIEVIERHMSTKARSKSHSRVEQGSESPDVFIVDDIDGLRIKEKKRSNSQKHKTKKSSKNPLNHPPWNNDTRIEGYEDVDENGKYKNKNHPYLGGDLRKKKEEQDKLNEQWSHSLRDTFDDE
uniref:Uncharacterized protein n=1 Tax=Acrobeloides nanus TaxID=290746 RepID=A0A914DKP0_9BILA